MDDPVPPWSITDAVRAVATGYDLDAIAERSGFAAAHIIAAAAAGRIRCPHAEHVEVDGTVLGRRTYAIDAPWSPCAAAAVQA